MIVAKGSKVKVEYRGSLADGTIFDSSERAGKPLEFTAGSGEVIKGFDAAIMGMKVGEEKIVTIPAGDAYGEKKPIYLTKVPKEPLAKKQEVKVGMILELTLPTGKKTRGRVVEVAETEVTIDFNHPLAGRDLTFWLKVVDIVKTK